MQRCRYLPGPCECHANSGLAKPFDLTISNRLRKDPGASWLSGNAQPAKKKFREPGLAGPLNLAGIFFIVYDCRDGDGLNRIGCVDFFIHASQAVWEIPDGTYRCIPKKLLSATTAHCGEKPCLPSLKNHREYHGSPLFSDVKPGYLIPRATVPLRARFHPLA